MRSDDLASCADLGLCEAAASFDGRGHFAGWLHLHVRRAIVADLRRERGDSRCPPRPRTVHVEPRILERVTIDRAPFEAIDLASRLAQLPRRTAQMILLRYCGYELEEIGAVFGVSPSRVCQLAHEGWLRASLKIG
jgi:RNA polymerase sigma factor (sigma-70 family)